MKIQQDIMNNHSTMKNNLYIKGIAKTARRMAVGCFLLFAFAGGLMAQNDSPFVIKKDGNYLAHMKVEDNYVLQNASSFNPATCLWYSGPTYNPTGYTHNYYFEDDAHTCASLPLRCNPTPRCRCPIPCLQCPCCAIPTRFITSTTGTPRPS